MTRMLSSAKSAALSWEKFKRPPTRPVRQTFSTSAESRGKILTGGLFLPACTSFICQLWFLFIASRSRYLPQFFRGVVGFSHNLRTAKTGGLPLLLPPSAVGAQLTGWQYIYNRWQHTYNTLGETAISTIKMLAATTGTRGCKPKHLRRSD